MGPLDLLRPDPPSRWGGVPPRNALVELHNLVAAAASPRDFGPADRVRISRQHGVDLVREFRAERVAIYQALLDDRLATTDFGAEDRRALAHVAQTLALGPADVRPAHERAFGVAVTEAVADDCLSVDERLLLYKLQHVLGLDPRLADGAYGVIARQRVLRAVADALCDGELAPDEEAQIALAESALSVALPPDVRSRLVAARRQWQLRHGELPEVQVEVDLQASEVGRTTALARWGPVHAEWLRRSVGASTLHAGRTAALRFPVDTLAGSVHAGRAVLTSRRLVLSPGTGLPDEVRLTQVVQTLRFRDGIVVRTKAGRHVYLDPGSETEPFYAVLYRAVESVAASPD